MAVAGKRLRVAHWPPEIIACHHGGVMEGEVVPAASRVELITRAGCHLCDDARDVVSAVCGELSVGWSERDLAGDPGLADQYSDLIPVVLVDGIEHAAWRVDAVALARALRTP